MNSDDYRELRKRIERIERQTAKLPSRINLGAGAGGSGRATEWMKKATTKAGLTEPAGEEYFGRVTAGADQGMVCVRNPDNDGWDAINFFE